MRYAPLIRKAAARGQYGHRRTPATFYMGTDYCGYHHSWNRDLFPTHAEWIAAARVLERYQRFYRHVTEVAPGWVDGERVHYMDNSVEVVQTARDGRTRRVQVVAPHGDVCF